MLFLTLDEGHDSGRLCAIISRLFPYKQNSVKQNSPTTEKIAVEEARFPLNTFIY